jgi:uncharacterized protein (DUF983 family)
MQPLKRAKDEEEKLGRDRTPFRVVKPGGNGSAIEGTRSERVGLSRVLVLFGRALLLRCAVCGSGGVMASWFRTKRRCPTCGFALEREEGYFSGAMAVNLIATELILTAVLVTLLVVSWPLVVTWPMAPSVQVTWYAAIAAAGILPLLTYPFSRTMWIAFDLVFRPPTPADFRPEIPRLR